MRQGINCRNNSLSLISLQHLLYLCVTTSDLIDAHRHDPVLPSFKRKYINDGLCLLDRGLCLAQEQSSDCLVNSRLSILAELRTVAFAISWLESVGM